MVTEGRGESLFSAPSIGVVIPHYGYSSLLTESIEVLRLLLDGNPGWHCVIVQNGQAIPDVRSLDKKFLGKVETVIVDRPIGYAAACNLGARYLEKWGTQYAWFLNNDVSIPKATSVIEVVRLGQDHGLDIFTGMVVSTDGSVLRNWFGFPTYRRSAARFLRKRRESDASVGAITTVECVSGISMFVRCSLFRALRGFDERFFMYNEDLDLCYRATRRGARIGVVGVVHVVNNRPRDCRKIRERALGFTRSTRSLLQFFAKHKGRLRAFGYVPLTLAIETWSWFGSGHTYTPAVRRGAERTLDEE